MEISIFRAVDGLLTLGFATLLYLHAGWVATARRPCQEHGRMRVVCQNTCSFTLRLSPTSSYFSPLRPLLLALAPVPWSGVWGRPLLFCCFSPVFLPLRLVRCSRTRVVGKGRRGQPYWLKLTILILHKRYLNPLRYQENERPELRSDSARLLLSKSGSGAWLRPTLLYGRRNP